MSYGTKIITPEEFREQCFGAIRREGLAIINFTSAVESESLSLPRPIEHVTRDDQTGAWYAHVKSIDEPVRLEDGESLTATWTIDALIEQARAIVIEYANGHTYASKQIRIRYDADHVYVGLPIPSDDDSHTPVAVILRGTKQNEVETFRYGKWIAHLQSLAKLAQENKALREREAAEAEAQAHRMKFAPIDDADLFAEPVAAVQS